MLASWVPRREELLRLLIFGRRRATCWRAAKSSLVSQVLLRWTSDAGPTGKYGVAFELRLLGARQRVFAPLQHARGATEDAATVRRARIARVGGMAVHSR